MGLLDKWRPSRELERFRGEFDDLLERFGMDRDWLGREPTRPAIESGVENGKFVVRTDLPGIDPKDIEIKVVGDVLTIKGSREEKHETSKADFFKREIRYGSFERAISLPVGIKANDLTAAYRNGVLELTAPMAPEAAPQAVKIQVEGTQESGPKKAAT